VICIGCELVLEYKDVALRRNVSCGGALQRFFFNTYKTLGKLSSYLLLHAADNV
jgi:hypothetical protein